MKEENLGFQADELDEAVVDMEWEETLLVPKVAALQSRHDRYLREIAGIDSNVDVYRAVILCQQDHSAGLRRMTELSREEADQLRQQAGQDCVSGINHRVI